MLQLLAHSKKNTIIMLHLYNEFLTFYKNTKDIGRLMCIDFGKKNVGIAFSDLYQAISLPHSVYKRTRLQNDLAKLNELYQHNNAIAIVLGITSQKDAWHLEIQNFAKEMIKKYNINIYLENEDFSTTEALECLQHLHYKKQRLLDNKISASLILKRTLDKIYRIKQ